MAELYRADTDALGLGRPDHEPLASETIGPIIDYIGALIDSGHAYPAGGDVYFRVRSDADYGSLSHRRLEHMDQGEDLEGSERKEDPLDFALWKAHKPGEDTVWESPWGRGRPGWHIECSAMAEEFLGVGFDIHGGGSDLLFPHHENEAAQTRGARGRELARLWMHNGMIQFTGEKMAKSVGNIAPLHEVLARHGPETVLMYLISGHYRQPLAFSPAALEEARGERLPRARGAAAPAGAPAEPAGDGTPPRGLLRRPRRRLQHAGGAGRAVRVDARGEPPRRRESETPICARCWRCWASVGWPPSRRRAMSARSTRWPCRCCNGASRRASSGTSGGRSHARGVRRARLGAARRSRRSRADPLPAQ